MNHDWKLLELALGEPAQRDTPHSASSPSLGNWEMKGSAEGNGYSVLDLMEIPDTLVNFTSHPVEHREYSGSTPHTLQPRTLRPNTIQQHTSCTDYPTLKLSFSSLIDYYLEHFSFRRVVEKA